MDGTVAILGKLLEDMPHTSLSPNHRVSWNPESLRQRIRRLETNAVDVEGQAVRILLDAGNRLVAVGLVDTDGSGSANAMGVEEDHNLSNDFLGFPRLNDSLLTLWANAVEIHQP